MSTLFLRNKYLLVLSIVIILVAGVSAIISLPRLEDPRITNRNPLVITVVPGASAERVETLVTEKIEEELKEVSEIKDVESTSQAGISLVSIELKDEVTTEDNEEIFSKIRDKLSDAVVNFPKEARLPIFDDKRGPIAFTLILGITWTHDTDPKLGVLNRLAEDLADRLRNVSGTELVRIYGEPTEEITVTVDQDELSKLGLSTVDVSSKIAQADSKVPAGLLRSENTDLFMEVQGELDSLSRIGEVPLMTNGASSVLKIGDVAQIDRNWQDPPSEIALADGNRTVFVGVRMSDDIRVDKWAKIAKAQIDDFTSTIGSGIEIETVFDQSIYTNEKLSQLGGNLIAGALVIMAVIFFIMGWRSSLIIGSALPLVAASVLFIMILRGGALHQMSIFGMIIALGLLIDNAIIVVDEVNSYLQNGYKALEAVRLTVNHLFAPLLASTLTTVLAFMPILLLPGNAGDFVGSIGGSVIMAIIASYLISLTIIVSLAGIFAKAPGKNQKRRWWKNGYQNEHLSSSAKKWLLKGMKKPVFAIMVAFILPVLGFILSTQLGNEFFPPVDRNMFEVKVWMPPESSILNTKKQAQEIEKVVREFEGVENVNWLIGGSFPMVYYNLIMNKDDTPFYAHSIITTDSSNTTKKLIPKIQRELDSRFPAAQVVVRQFGQGPPIEADIQIRLYGPNIKMLQDLGEELRLEFQSHPDVLHTQMSMPRGKPKLWVEANEDEASIAGFSLTDLALQLEGNQEGITGGSVLENLEELPVRIRYSNERRGDFSYTGSTNYVSPSGEIVPLNAIGKLTLKPALGGITRFDGIRMNKVEAYTKNGALPIDVTFEVLDRIESEGFTLPPGYSYELGGAVEQDSEAVGNLAIYAPILVTMMIAILILTFRSVSLALVLLVVALMSIGLGQLSTWMIGFPVSFNTILGTLGLIGIAINDSIVVLAAIRGNPVARAGDPEAVVEVVMGCLRHVISTTLTTMGGFLPLLIFVGGEFWPSLAIVLVGGIAGATILAVLFIPGAYILLNRKKQVLVPEAA
ncbi:MAG: efflux RND transporter permease subunit [Thermodesulfobacteriota bacterium]